MPSCPGKNVPTFTCLPSSQPSPAWPKQDRGGRSREGKAVGEALALVTDREALRPETRKVTPGGGCRGCGNRQKNEV